MPHIVRYFQSEEFSNAFDIIIKKNGCLKLFLIGIHFVFGKYSQTCIYSTKVIPVKDAKVIHITKCVVWGFLIYTPSYPHYPPKCETCFTIFYGNQETFVLVKSDKFNEKSKRLAKKTYV